MTENEIFGALYVCGFMAALLGTFCVGEAIMWILDKIPFVHNKLEAFYATLPDYDDEDDWDY